MIINKNQLHYINHKRIMGHKNLISTQASCAHEFFFFKKTGYTFSLGQENGELTYFKPYFCLIFCFLKHFPESLFKKSPHAF